MHTHCGGGRDISYLIPSLPPFSLVPEKVLKAVLQLWKSFKSCTSAWKNIVTWRDCCHIWAIPQYVLYTQVVYLQIFFCTGEMPLFFGSYICEQLLWAIKVFPFGKISSSYHHSFFKIYLYFKLLLWDPFLFLHSIALWKMF